MRRKLKSLLINKGGTIGNCAMSLLGLITSHVLTIGKKLGVFILQSTMNIERGTVLKNPQPVLFLFLKDINAQLSGLQAGKRYVQ
jgi:hypothetical protein